MTALTDFFIPAPLSAVYTLVLAVGMSTVYDIIGLSIFKRRDTWLRAMYFFSGLLITCWLIWILCLISFVPLILFRGLAAAFSLSGLTILLINKGGFFARDLYRDIFNRLSQRKRDKLFQALIAITLVAFILIALAPPTDADSLDYHLGIPIEILRKGSLWFGRDNIHFRMSGWGEMINLLGIVNGCAQLSAMLQVLGLFWLVAIFSNAVEEKYKIDIIVLIVGIPVLLFFVPGQKNQLLGALATTTCFYSLSRKSEELNGRIFTLFCLVLLLAVGIKYSFLISAASLVAMLILKYDLRNILSKLIQLFVYSIIVLSPIYLYKYSYFRDPLSPLLEGLKQYPDPVVVAVHEFLRHYKDSAFAFPLNLLFPSSIGNVSSFLGIGFLVVIVFLFNYWDHKAEVIAVFTFCLFTIIAGQRTARFFIEPFLWILPVFFLYARSSWIKQLSLVSKAQYLLMIPCFAFLLYVLFPGTFSNKQREQLMYRSALGYAHTRWLDSTLSKKDVILTDVRSRSLFHQPVFPIEYILYANMLQKKYPDSLKSMILHYKVRYLVLPDMQRFRLIKKNFAGNALLEPMYISNAVRNPFNKKKISYCIYNISY